MNENDLIYRFPFKDQFVNQEEHLKRLAKWYESDNNRVLGIYGRRRIGKTWLMKNFADSKKAIFLTARSSSSWKQEKDLYEEFSEQLKIYLPVKPVVNNLSQLFEVLYKAGQEEKILIILDEFPYLLSKQKPKKFSQLTEIQSAIEKFRDASNNKIIICGSFISQMESLFQENNPLYDRVLKHELKPLSFSQRQKFNNSLPPKEKITRAAISGGATKYVSYIFQNKDLDTIIKEEIINEFGDLYSDPLTTFSKEMRNITKPFDVMQHLIHPKTLSQLEEKITDYEPYYYIQKLKNLELIEERSPVGSIIDTRKTQFYIKDGFLRFWFRFVYPIRKQINKGMDTNGYYGKIKNHDLEDFTGFYFEFLCQEYCLKKYPELCYDDIGSWWGKSLHKYRRKPDGDPLKRVNEEIDIVGRKNKTLTLIGECKWNKKPMSPLIIDDILNYKLPALKEESKAINPESHKKVNRFVKVDHPKILLFSKSGFSEELKSKVKEIEKFDFVLIDLEELLQVLLG